LALISVAIGAAYEHFYGAAIGMTFYPWQPSFKYLRAFVLGLYPFKGIFVLGC